MWGNFETLTGVEVSSTNSECIVSFTSTSSNSWSPPAGVDHIRTLVVGGGGGGGYHVGSGGGGGGVLDSYIQVDASSDYDISVGRGGTGGEVDGPCSNLDSSSVGSCGNSDIATVQTNGADSSFGPLSALGGGRGGSWNYIAPNSGGSGGGASYYGSYFASGNAIVSGPGQGATAGGVVQGFAGGGYGSADYGAGGGGGAGAAPADAVGAVPGDGGHGRATTISGETQYFGGGGGGGNHNAAAAGSGGVGGGGDGASSSNTRESSQNGQTNTGGGGGGGGFNNAGDSAGGNGGAGVVILR